MANISLPTPSSQARSIAPATRSTQPTALSQLLQAAPGIANSFARAVDVKNRADNQRAQAQKQAALDTQAAEDKQTVGEAIMLANDLTAQKQEATNTSNDLQRLAASVNTRFDDGEISEEDKRVQQQYIATLSEFKNSVDQGLTRPGEFATKVNAARRQFMSENMHLAPEIQKAFDAVTGTSGGSTTGAVTQRELAFQNRMNDIYRGDITPDRVRKEQRKIAAVADMEANKALGTVSFGQATSTNNQALNIALDTMTAKAATAYGEKQALDQGEIDAFNAQISQLKINLNRSFDEEIASLRQDGQIIDPAAARAAKDFNIKQLDDLQKSINDKDLQKMLAKREQLDTSMWKNGLGGQISKINSVASLLGDGGITALNASMSATNETQSQVIASLTQGTGLDPSFLTNTKQLMIDAAQRITSPQPVPGFEKLDAWYGLGAQKAGETSDQLKINTLTNLNKMVVDADDVSGAVKQMNNPRISAGYIGAGKETTNQLVNSTNAWDTITVDSINERGLDVNFDQQTQRFVVSKSNARPASESFGQGQSVLARAAGPKTQVFRSLTQDLNNLYDLHRNPNYGSILQPADKWLADIIQRTQQVPTTTSDQASE